ncbi:class I SAM-dependent methyltransferase [Fervidobacterium nodosum]|uniref:Methyltransferase type 11 n=1 Tax=Fervidobacterium nodosum (strain ATCC 35602 / DSM 5306 / Rt17-B1) TaxID=381764 RepID=A7HMX0_FERNB|nr:class I SAM-dependent methyltransferase [Fervidobacterium nodosum]ABS61253.1 Methyltransferase type 11 [Fervidobacterium nodosum Rt17-B1]
MDRTLDYYNKNAKKFFEDTINVDMSFLYQMFLKYIPARGKILDLGSGSGRDTKYFLERGFSVVATDASPEMVKISTEYTGIQTLHMSFDELNFVEEFDGVWACASLLHVKRSEIDDILYKIRRALKPNGILYASFKYGNKEEYREDGRYFNYYDEDAFSELLKNHPYFKLLETAITTDVRKDRANEKWLNVILKRV